MPDPLSARSIHRASVGRSPVGGRIEVAGRVENPLVFDDARLVEMSSLDPSSGRQVLLTDLLAAVRLRTDAEILVVEGRDGSSFGVPVRDVVGHDDARLVLGSRHDPFGVVIGISVRLEVVGWTDDLAPVDVSRITAVGFAEFVARP